MIKECNIMSVCKTTLNDMRYIFHFLGESKSDCRKWANTLKIKFPNTRMVDAGYDFHPDEVWDFILQNKKWKIKLEEENITSFGELSYRAIPFNDYAKYDNRVFCDDCGVIYSGYCVKCPTCSSRKKYTEDIELF